jgi:hypothetical protein
VLVIKSKIYYNSLGIKGDKSEGAGKLAFSHKKRKVGSQMRRMRHRKAVASLLVVALAAGTAMTGCGKKTVDYGVDGEKGKSGDGAKLASKLNVPESCDETLEGIDSETGLTQVTVKDDSIEIPDKDSMSVMYYEENAVDNDYRKRVCESFFDTDAGIYVYDWEKPYKEDVQNQIDTYQTLIDQSTDEDEKSYLEEYLETLQDELKTATDEREGAGDYTADTYVGYVGENMFMIGFTSADYGTGGGFYIDYYPSDSLIEYRPKDGATNLYSYSSEYGDDVEDTTNLASMSKDEAVAKGLEFLASCGISDVVETSAVDLLWEYSDASYNTVADEYDGYVVTFMRSVDGVSPYSPYVYNIDILNSDDEWYDSVSESFELNIDDNGIVSAYCNDVLKATDDKDANVDIISWDDALAALPDAINTYYTAHSTQYSTIEFNDVRLAYYLIQDGDTYKYTPVWVFAQADSDAEDGLDVDYPIQLVMLDATTGELIDLTKVLTSESYSDEDTLDYDDYYDEGSDDEISDGDTDTYIDDDGNIILDDNAIEIVDENSESETEAATEESEDTSAE